MAAGRFGTVRLRTTDAPAAAFYEALGFVPVDEVASTHWLSEPFLLTPARSGTR